MDASYLHDSARDTFLESEMLLVQILVHSKIERNMVRTTTRTALRLRAIYITMFCGDFCTIMSMGMYLTWRTLLMLMFRWGMSMERLITSLFISLTMMWGSGTGCGGARTSRSWEHFVRTMLRTSTSSVLVRFSRSDHLNISWSPYQS